MTVLYGLIVLGILIIIHELGHFIAARLTRVHVFEFAVGFGAKLYSFRIGETEFSIRAIPLGGFVSLAGLDETDKFTDPERSYMNKSLIQKVFIILAGPMANFLSAFLFLWIAVFFYGTEVPDPRPVVGDVLSHSPAQKAGFRSGDYILKVNDKNITTFAEIAEIIQRSEGPVKFEVQRMNEVLTISVVPEYESQTEAFLRNDQVTRKLVGLIARFDYEPVTLYEACVISAERTVSTSGTILKVVWGLLTGKISKKELAGPVLIISEAGTNVKKGFKSLLMFMFILSVNLALLNLLPIPILDGGHLAILLVEGLIGRPVPVGVKNFINYIGFAFLAILTILVLKNDIKRLLFG
ncbi:MAG: RIP metalloprotease RseP [Deltaproteobacteria bacterium]|nr:RIP metalloprotease RseP [Deltaproteobacteria bacterium]